MRTTPQLLDAMKKRLKVPSDYALAKHLGMIPNRISNYRTGTSKFDDEMCLRAAEVLQEPPSVILAEVAAERAKRPDVKKAWESVARAAAAGATALFLLVFVGGWLPVDGLELAFLMPAGITHYAQLALQIGLTLALAAACCTLTTRTLPGHQNRSPIA